MPPTGSLGKARRDGDDRDPGGEGPVARARLILIMRCPRFSNLHQKMQMLSVTPMLCSRPWCLSNMHMPCQLEDQGPRHQDGVR
jgi:hypothetical protein